MYMLLDIDNMTSIRIFLNTADALTKTWELFTVLNSYLQPATEENMAAFPFIVLLCQ